jgi:hypothetical protein
MKFYLKKEIYFEVEIENGSDRALVTKSFDEIVDPAFNKLIEKIRFAKTEINALRKLTGYNVDCRALSKPTFMKMTNISSTSL